MIATSNIPLTPIKSSSISEMGTRDRKVRELQQWWKMLADGHLDGKWEPGGFIDECAKGLLAHSTLNKAR